MQRLQPSLQMRKGVPWLQVQHADKGQSLAGELERVKAALERERDGSEAQAQKLREVEAQLDALGSELLDARAAAREQVMRAMLCGMPFKLSACPALQASLPASRVHFGMQLDRHTVGKDVQRWAMLSRRSSAGLRWSPCRAVWQ